MTSKLQAERPKGLVGRAGSLRYQRECAMLPFYRQFTRSVVAALNTRQGWRCETLANQGGTAKPFLTPRPWLGEGFFVLNFVKA